MKNLEELIQKYTKNQNPVIRIGPGSFYPKTGTENSSCTVVAIEHSFEMWKTPVTQSQFQKLMEYNPSQVKRDDTKNHPVEYVSWYEAAKFCNKLSMKDGLEPFYNEDNLWNYDESRHLEEDGWRLPYTEEWEYACRGGSNHSDTYANLEAIAHYGAYGDEDGTKPVAQKQPNAWGLYDILGNVWEWTNSRVDVFGNTALAGKRAIIGGAYDCPDWVLKKHKSIFWEVVRPGSDTGFRPVRTIL